jgi:hypothetical protein
VRVEKRTTFVESSGKVEAKDVIWDCPLGDLRLCHSRNIRVHIGPPGTVMFQQRGVGPLIIVIWDGAQ